MSVNAGAGKTTLLNHILSNQAGQRVAVLVNDMASLNIDERLVAQNVLKQSGQELVALSNGCICCTIREDLVREITALATQQVRLMRMWLRHWLPRAMSTLAVTPQRLQKCTCLHVPVPKP